MRAVMTHVSSLVAGAVVSRLFDSERGRRRRAMLRDKVVSAGHTVADAAETTARDVRNRTQGTIASLRSRWRAETPDNRVLAERVRARLGGVGTHPGAIEVDARDGVVTLCGPVLEADVAAVVGAVAAVRGVCALDDRLDVHAAPGDVPGLQAKLVADRAKNLMAVNVDTTQGVVQLRGTVATDRDREEAERLARGTRGVRDVHNELIVSSGAASPRTR